MKIKNINFRLEVEIIDDEGFHHTTNQDLGSRYEWSLPESWRMLNKEQQIKLIVEKMELEALRLQKLLNPQEEIKEEAEEDDKEH